LVASVLSPVLGKETAVAAIDADVPIAMRKVYRRLEGWRSRRTGRARIPESLWVAAGELARQHGVNPVSKALRLEFNHLKRMAESSGRVKPKRPAMASGVGGLDAAPTRRPQECVIELEGRRGKLRIELKGPAAADLAGVSRALWEMVS